MSTHWKTARLAALLLLMAAPAPAQIIGPGVDAGVIEIGYTHKWFHRDLEPVPPVESRWEIATFFARYGLFERATIAMEGGLWYVAHDDFPDQSYRRWTAGVGASVLGWSHGRWRVGGFGNYAETFDRDRSASHFHKRVKSFVFGIHLERVFDIRGQHLSAWAAPVYAHDEGDTYVYGTTTSLATESEQDFGAAVGLNAVVFRRGTVFAHLLVVQYSQWRLGAALRLP